MKRPPGLFGTLQADLPASLVVFLVAIQDLGAFNIFLVAVI